MKNRNQLLAAIHIGKKTLGLDDDVYRDMLENLTGKRSAKDLNLNQLHDVVKHLDSLGFKNQKDFGNKPKVSKPKQAKLNKIEALLAEKGLHWNYAIGIAKKMFTKEALEFCTSLQLTAIIAALEKQKKRTQSDEVGQKRNQDQS